MTTKTLALALDAQKKASDACNALPEVHAYNGIRALYNAQLEKKYPGFVLDWQSQTLKAKGAK